VFQIFDSKFLLQKMDDAAAKFEESFAELQELVKITKKMLREYWL